MVASSKAGSSSTAPLQLNVPFTPDASTSAASESGKNGKAKKTASEMGPPGLPTRQSTSGGASSLSSRRSVLPYEEGARRGGTFKQRPIELTEFTPSNSMGASTQATQATQAQAVSGVEAPDDAPSVAGTRTVAEVRVVEAVGMPSARKALLERLNGEPRAIDAEKVLDAILMRRLGEDHYDKNEWNKLVPGLVERLRMRFGTFNDLVGKDFDAVRSHLVDNPGVGSRHLLNQLSRMKLLEGIGIDSASFMNGAIRKSFLAAGFKWEQLHTNVGRVFTSSFIAVAWGVDFIPDHHKELIDGLSQDVVDKAVKAGKRAGQVACSVLPAFVTTPLVTGAMRSATDVFESFDLTHGFPALSPGLTKAQNMDSQKLKAQGLEAQERRKAFEAIDWKASYPEGMPPLDQLPKHHRDAVENMLESAYRLYKVADTDYKLSMGAEKASAVGKAAGSVMNGLGTGTTVLSYLKRYDIAFFWSLGLIAVQPLSGMQDKNAMATYYTDAGVKWDWRSLLKEPYRNLPPDQLKAEHIDTSVARKRWTDLNDVVVGAVSEVCKYQLANKLADFDESLQDLLKLQEKRTARASASPSASTAELDRQIAGMRLKLESQCGDIEGWRADIGRFYSRKEDDWAKISSSHLGPYLDGKEGLTNKLKTGQLEARLNKPGEVLSQVMQRYQQLFQDLPVSFAALYAAANIMQAKGVPSVACEAILAIGAANFAGNTLPPRSQKPRNKGVLAKPLAGADQQASDLRSARIPEGLSLPDGMAERYAREGRWEYEEHGADSETTPLLPDKGKTVPLTGESGYRKARDSVRERVRQLGNVVGSGVFSGPRALGRLATTSWQRGNAHDELKAVHKALEAAGFDKGAASTPAALNKGTSMSSTRARLEGYAVVKAYLAEQAAQTQRAADDAMEASRAETVVETAPEFPRVSAEQRPERLDDDMGIIPV